MELHKGGRKIEPITELNKDTKAKEISELPSSTAIHDDDVFMIEGNGTTSKVFAEELVNFIKTHEGVDDYFAHIDLLVQHIQDNNNPHLVDKGTLGLGHVENKSPQEILDMLGKDDIISQLTKDDIIAILGYTPGEGGNGEGSCAIATELAPGTVKSGTDIEVDSQGNVSVKDNSHLHTIQNITGLEEALGEPRSGTNIYLTGKDQFPADWKIGDLCLQDE